MSIYLNFEDVTKEGDIYFCKQKVKSKNGGMVEYNIRFEKTIANDREDFYTASDIELTSPFDIWQIDENIIEKQVHGTLCDLNHDEKKEEMVKLFEEYENTKYPLYAELIDLSTNAVKYKQEKLEALEYVKGNFTDSGYDEYFVIFCEEVPGPEYGRYPERVRCFIVDEGKIIKEYFITVPIAFFFSPLDDIVPYNSFPNLKISGLSFCKAGYVILIKTVKMKYII